MNESRHNIRISPMKGKHHIKSSKQKMRESHLGQIAWNKGKHHSEETIQKMKRSLKGRIPWNKGKKVPQMTGVNHPMYGKHHTEEAKQKNREKHLGKSPGNKGKHPTEEQLKKLRESHIGKKNVNKGKTYEQIYGVEKAKLLREDLSKKQLGEKHRLYGKKQLEITRKKISDKVKQNWRNEEIAKKMMNGQRPNGKELYLDFLLQNHFPDEWKYVGDGQVIIGGLCPDFINVNGKKLIIELFGDYWHNIKNMKYHRTEHGRIEVFLEYGYSTLIIWEHELEDENKVIEKIKHFDEYLFNNSIKKVLKEIKEGKSKKSLIFDLDGTICDSDLKDYSIAEPDEAIITLINKLYDNGNTIIIFTARGATSGKDWRSVTEKQLKRWGVRYHQLIMGYPKDLVVDDVAITPEDFICEVEFNDEEKVG